MVPLTSHSNPLGCQGRAERTAERSRHAGAAERPRECPARAHAGGAPWPLATPTCGSQHRAVPKVPTTPAVVHGPHRLALILGGCLILGACGPSTTSRGLPVIPITFPDGTLIRAEVATTPDAHAQGLMFRHHLPATAGMLFVFEKDTLQTFWMKNTLIPLDMVFLSPEQRIRQLIEDVPPADPASPDDQIPQMWGQAQYVLELPAGTIRRHRLTIGDVISFELPPHLPSAGRQRKSLTPFKSAQ